MKSAKICLESGKLAGDLCTKTTSEVFIAGTEPQDKCHLHAVAARMNAHNSEQPEENAWSEAR